MAKKPKRSGRNGKGQSYNQQKQTTVPIETKNHSIPDGFFGSQTGQTEQLLYLLHSPDSGKNYTYKKPDNANIAALLIENRGNLYVTAKNLNVSRTTVYAWIEAEPVLELARTIGHEERIDWVESKLDELIEGVWFEEPIYGKVYKRPPNFKAIELFLLTQGKKRGYIRDNKPVQGDQTASLWVQLHGLMEQARQAYDTQGTIAPESGAMEIP